MTKKKLKLSNGVFDLSVSSCAFPTIPAAAAARDLNSCGKIMGQVWT